MCARAGATFLLDGIVSRPEAGAPDAGFGRASAHGDMLMALPQSPEGSRRGRGNRGGGGGGSGGGGVMLRMLSMTAQDTLGSITGRAAATEWAHQQVSGQ